MGEKEQIKMLHAREHIRLRPSMYIGSIGKAGMHYLLIGLMRFLCEQNKLKTELLLDLSNEVIVLKFKGTSINQMVNSNAEGTLKALTGLEQNLIDANDSYFITVLFHLASYLKVITNKGDIFILNKGKFDISPGSAEQVDWLSFHFKLDNELFGNSTFSKVILSSECEKLAALNSNVQIQLLDNRNGCNYNERFTMEDGLLQLFNNQLDRFNSDSYDSPLRNFISPNFHIKIKEPQLSLELIFKISNQKHNFKKSYYRYINLTNGGSHISYLKMRLKKLNKKLNIEFDWFDNDLNFYSFMTNVETKHPFPFAGPTKTRIEDPMLVQIMKSAFDKLEPEIISFYTTKNTPKSL